MFYMQEERSNKAQRTRSFFTPLRERGLYSRLLPILFSVLSPGCSHAPPVVATLTPSAACTRGCVPRVCRVGYTQVVYTGTYTRWCVPGSPPIPGWCVPGSPPISRWYTGTSHIPQVVYWHLSHTRVV